MCLSYNGLCLHLVIWICTWLSCSGYIRYEVEDLCSSGKMEIELANNGSLSSAILKATRHTSYRLAMDCEISLKAPEGCGLVVSLRQVGFRLAFDGTCKDWIKIHYFEENEERDVTLCQNEYDLDEAQSFISSHLKNSDVKIVYYVDNDGLDNHTMSGYPGFELTITAYFCSGDAEAKSVENVFQCDTGCYVWEGLKCDSHNNCGDMSDESGEGRANCTGLKIITIVIGGTALTLFLFISILASLVWGKKLKNRGVFMQLRRRRRRQNSQSDIIQAALT